MLYDIQWLEEDVIVELENLAAPMGPMGTYRVIETKLIISIDQPRPGSKRQTAGFGQVKRLVLLKAIPDASVFMKADFVEELL